MTSVGGEAGAGRQAPSPATLAAWGLPPLLPPLSLHGGFPHCSRLQPGARPPPTHPTPTQARDSLERSVCWPSAWVAGELPEARLLSAEYAAPASGWEGESLPFQHTVAQVWVRVGGGEGEVVGGGRGREEPALPAHRRAGVGVGEGGGVGVQGELVCGATLRLPPPPHSPRAHAERLALNRSSITHAHALTCTQLPGGSQRRSITQCLPLNRFHCCCCR